jgi:hypothetical protein
MIIVQVNNIIKRALKVIRAESIYQNENDDAREYILDSLNDILSIMNSTEEYIPYFDVLALQLKAGQKIYTIGTDVGSYLVVSKPIQTIEYVNILLNGYRYTISIQDNFSTQGISYPLSISGLPTLVNINKNFNEQILDFFPTPVQNYDCEIMYKTTFADVRYGIAVPDYYRKFLIYWLAKETNVENNLGTWNQDAESSFLEYKRLVKAGIQKDIRVRTNSPIVPAGYNGYYWNLGVRTG